MKKILSRLYTKELIILYLSILIGAYLRLTGVFNNSFAFTYDVGRDMIALSNIVNLHKIPLIGATTGIEGVFYGPWWYYFLTPFFILFRGNPQGIALVMAIIGIITIPAAFFVGSKIGGRRLGVIFSALVSVSPVFISLSSQIWNPNIAPIFLMALLFVIFKIFSEKRKDIYFLLLGILLSLNLDIEIFFGIMLSIGILAALLIITRSLRLKQIFLLILGYVLIAAPRIVFELRHQFLITKSFFKFITANNATGKPLNILVNLADGIRTIFNQISSTLATENFFIAILLIIFSVIVLIIYFKNTDKLIKKFIYLSLITIIFFLIGITVFNHDIWFHYLVGLPVLYILLFSLSLEIFFKNTKYKSVALLVIILLFLINLNPMSLYKSITSKLWIGDASVYRNQLSVVDYIYKESQGRQFKYVVYTPPVYDYTYQYLFSWYGPNVYKYKPMEQSNLAYFIIEPDSNKNRENDWIKSRENDGKIIKSIQMPSGIIIQTRVH